MKLRRVGEPGQQLDDKAIVEFVHLRQSLLEKSYRFVVERASVRPGFGEAERSLRKLRGQARPASDARGLSVGRPGCAIAGRALHCGGREHQRTSLLVVASCQAFKGSLVMADGVLVGRFRGRFLGGEHRVARALGALSEVEMVRLRTRVLEDLPDLV